MFCNPYVGFSQAPEHVEGGGVKHEEGGGSARLITDDWLKYLFIYLFIYSKKEGYKERKYIT
jgi:hypothetical protein